MGDAPVLVRVVQRVQEVADAVESCALLVVGLDDRPRRVGGVGMEEHRLLGGGVVVPFVQRLDVDGRQLPVLERIVAARDEAPQLFLAAHREPVLEQQDAAVGEHALQLRRLAHELQVLQRRTEAHDPLDAGAVVPGAVEEDHLAGGGQVLDVALEIPLALLLGGRFLQATIRAPRGFRCSMKRLMVPPCRRRRGLRTGPPRAGRSPSPSSAP